MTLAPDSSGDEAEKVGRDKAKRLLPGRVFDAGGVSGRQGRDEVLIRRWGNFSLAGLSVTVSHCHVIGNLGKEKERFPEQSETSGGFVGYKPTAETTGKERVDLQ